MSFSRITFLFIFILLFSTLSGFSISKIDSIKMTINENLEKNNYSETLQLYKNLETEQDKFFYSNYNNEIKSIYDNYDIEKKELQNRRHQNKLLITYIIFLIVFIVIIVYIFLILRHKNNLLIESRKELYSVKQLAEYSIRNKSLIISNMTHEIRTPLNALIGFTEVITQEDISKEIKQQCSDIIKLNSDLLNNLINDVLISKDMNIDSLDFDLKQYDIVVLCEKLVKTMQKIKETEAEIVFHSDIKSLFVETDIARIQQVIINLLSNAIKFCKKGSITLSIDRYDNDRVEFSLTDTGCGISKEKQIKVFERFEKLNESANGTGLGLSICKQIINRLNGKIYIDPNYTSGARFIFTHPVRQ